VKSKSDCNCSVSWLNIPNGPLLVFVMLDVADPILSLGGVIEQCFILMRSSSLSKLRFRSLLYCKEA
jgi:hypothetical protein